MRFFEKNNKDTGKNDKEAEVSKILEMLEAGRDMHLKKMIKEDLEANNKN